MFNINKTYVVVVTDQSIGVYKSNGTAMTMGCNGEINFNISTDKFSVFPIMDLIRISEEDVADIIRKECLEEKE